MTPILPTMRGWVMIIAAFISIAIALVNVGLATALTASTLTGVVVSSFVLAALSMHKIKLERRPNPDGAQNSSVTLPVAVKNLSWRFRQAMVVMELCPFVSGGTLAFAVPPLRPHEEVILERTSKAARRGHFTLSEIYLIGGDPAGLFRRRLEFDIPAEIMITPEITCLTSLPVTNRQQTAPDTEGRPLATSGQGQDFYGIREYRHGDEMRFIHWKATAAKRQLMVKEFEANTTDRIIIVLDNFQESIGIDPLDNNFEYLIRTTASIINYLTEFYCRITLVVMEAEGECTILKNYSAAVTPLAETVLTTLKPGLTNFETILDCALDVVQPGAIFFCLSMTQSDSIRRKLEFLQEMNVDVRWVYAPKLFFPYAAADTPRTINTGKLQIPEFSGGIRPMTVNFKTEIKNLLRNDF
ncbi:DUF58 domain-containing protein [Lentisphaerota bacterium ZTH]|nr:DUF58 domain-containing protein [Lentisphaerota bacterium]WET05505.1 DUF58 domain-containing protein [Lentisphaerota bacterium ZTH]